MTEQISNPDSLHARQLEFAAHLRDPAVNPAPSDVEDRRMDIYRSLFINSITSLLSGSYPVLKDLLGEDRWRLLVRDFYRDHHSRTPLFPEVSREFLDYLSNERPAGKKSDPEEDAPFLCELAHYEWVEAGLKFAEDPQPDSRVNPDGDMLDDCPVTWELAWLFAYRYPVHEIGKENQPDEPAAQPQHYLIYRNADDAVKFIKLNIISARLFELLSTAEALTGREALQAIATELQHQDPTRVIEAGAAILEQWRKLGIITGTLNHA
jgi:hypothetical protein